MVSETPQGKWTDALADPDCRRRLVDPPVLAAVAARTGSGPLCPGLAWRPEGPDLDIGAEMAGLAAHLGPAWAGLAATAPDGGGSPVALVLTDTETVVVPLLAAPPPGERVMSAPGDRLIWLLAGRDALGDRLVKDLVRCPDLGDFWERAAFDQGAVARDLIRAGVTPRWDGLLVGCARRLLRGLSGDGPLDPAEIQRLCHLLDHHREESAYRPLAPRAAAVVAMFRRPGAAIARAELMDVVETILDRPWTLDRRRRAVWARLGEGDIPRALDALQPLTETAQTRDTALRDSATLLGYLGWHHHAAMLWREVGGEGPAIDGPPSASAGDDLVVHLGFGKTGTSWFQRHVFPALPGCRFHGMYHPRLESLGDRPVDLNLRTPLVRAVQELIRTDSPDLASLGALLDQAAGGGGLHLISEENLVAVADRRRLLDWLDRLARAAGLRLRLLITVRPQADLLWSFYADVMASAGPHVPRRPWREVLDWGDGGGPAEGFRLTVDRYDFHAAWRDCVDRVGAGNVLVLPLAACVRPPHDGLSDLVNFLGPAVDPGDLARLGGRAPANAADARVRDALAALNPDRDSLHQRLTEHFAAGNAALSRAIGRLVP